MTGACRPTPNLDAIITKALLRLGNQSAPGWADRYAAAVRDALLAEGEIRVEGVEFRIHAYHGPRRDVLVVPLVADEDAP